MNLSSLLRPPFVAAALLLSLGATTRLSAQTPAGSTSDSRQPAAAPLRTYTGTITQISAAGVASTGTIVIHFNTGAKLDATAVINGVTTLYTGELLSSDPVRRAKGGGYHVPKTVGSFNTSSTINAPGITVAPGQIPLIVDKASAYGGLQTLDGGTLAFRAERNAK